MVKIFDGERWDVSSGETKIHRGTRSYLEKIGATLKEESAKDVPSSSVDPEGRYLVLQERRHHA